MIKPILFNTEMARALLDGHKTQTRRVIKPRYKDDESGFQVITTRSGEFVRVEKIDENECGIFADGTERYVNPPYSPGDVLWVRETWAKSMAGTYLYKATDAPIILERWRPSIHMPKEAARLFLRVTAVRAERLQEITEEQAEAEGAYRAYPYTEPNTGKTVFTRDERATYRGGFSAIWDSTIKPAKRECYGWEANPWVWVIEFERCDSPEDIL